MLGQGGFGCVTADGDKATKKFNCVKHLVAELFVTKYCSQHSSYVVKLRGCSFRNLTMSTTRWHTSLDKAINSEVLTVSNKRAIHKCVLMGLVHLETLHIVHADIKPANILVNASYTEAVIADFGISSSSNTAKVKQTSAAFSIKDTKAVSHRSHDLFSFVLLTLNLFYGYRTATVISTKKDLRDVCSRVITDGTLLSTMVGMIQDDPLKCWTSARALKTLYNKEVELPSPKFTLYTGASREIQLIAASVILETSSAFPVNKSTRLLDCCLLLAGSVSAPTSRIHMYMYALVYVFSCVFGYKRPLSRKDRMDVENVMELAECSRDEVNGLLSTIISANEVVSLMFAP